MMRHGKEGSLRPASSYAVASYSEPDERRDGYWKELYPDENSWQVIKDIEVLDALKKQGDDGTIGH